MLRPLALAVAALALAGCTNGSPRDAAPSPSSATPSATASVAAVATLRVRVESSAPADTVTAQVTARLAALGVTASHVDAAAGTIELPRALTAEELAAVRAPGRLTLRPVLRANPPGECATATGRAAVAARSAGAGAGAAIVACDAEGEATYDLGPAEITNADVASATVTDEPG
ncbi:MAG TPA: hypothetical protein VFQ85_01025, partial [Mycobacteriales bacterium]|nr:hypothetical protein [Mycobacteriales bacterium]